VSHDYDPAWDYDLDFKPPLAVVEAVAAAREELDACAAALGLQAPVVYYVRNLEDHLARYVNGTSSDPVFVVDARAIARGAKKYESTMEAAVVPTLKHELAHAYLESLGLEDFAMEEVVEGFAEVCWEESDEAGVAWLKEIGEKESLKLG
jgi:hypothetical protein